MAHMIDETTGRAAIAYIGATPWHGLGQALTPEGRYRHLDPGSWPGIHGFGIARAL